MEFGAKIQDVVDTVYLGDSHEDLTDIYGNQSKKPESAFMPMDEEPIIEKPSQFYTGTGQVHGGGMGFTSTTTINVEHIDPLTLDTLESKLDERDKKIEEKIYVNNRRFK